MKQLPWAVLFLLLLFGTTVFAQNSNSGANTNKNTNSAKSNVKRGPVFRATADQVKQAQAILKQRNFYGGEQNGKLDDPTRAGLKKYQEAESLKITGTLNRATLQKMGIALTDKQRSM